MHSDFSVRVAYEVLSIHLKRWCNKNDLTGTVLCLKRRCLLNICKLKWQTTTVRYSVTIIMFWWQFFGDGTISFLLGDTSSRSIARRNFPKTVCCRWTSNKVQSWTFSHTDAGWNILNALVNKKNKNVNIIILLLNRTNKITGRKNIANVLIIFKYRLNTSQQKS